MKELAVDVADPDMATAIELDDAPSGPGSSGTALRGA